MVVSEHALDHVSAGVVARREEVSLVVEGDFGQEDVVEEGLLIVAWVVVSESDQLVREALVDIVLPAVSADEFGRS